MPLPGAGISHADGEGFCPGSTGMLLVTSDSMATLEWMKGEECVQWGGESFETDVPGKYHVKVTKDGCSALTEELVLRRLNSGDPSCATAVEEQGLEAVRLFPNPCEGEVTLELPGDLGEGRVELYDITGRRLHSAAIEAGSAQIRLNVPGPGVHMVRLLHKGRERSIKVLAR
jgi:hypothetical protein